MKDLKENYQRTIIACFFGIASQAVIINLTAILFVYFMTLYHFSFSFLGVLVGVNFAVQMLAGVVLTFLIDRIGFRPLVLIACLLGVIGLTVYGLVGVILPGDLVGTGIVCATVLFSFSGGMLESLLSPIIDNIPETVKSKQTAMSLLHSFYAWGELVCIILTSLYLFVFGEEYWSYIVIFFAVIPFIAFLLFLHAPIRQKTVDFKKKSATTGVLLSPFFLIALLAMAFGGAAEMLMNQWVATFLIKGLGVNEMVADILGMGLFALSIGVGRALYGKFGDRWNLSKLLLICSLSSSILYATIGISQSALLALIASVLCGFTVSLLWPGTLVITSKYFPKAGSWIFVILTIAGNLGTTIFSAMTGTLTDSIGLSYTFLILSLVPLGAFFCHLFLLGKQAKSEVIPSSK